MRLKDAKKPERRYDALEGLQVERIYSQKDDGWTAGRGSCGKRYVSFSGIMPGVEVGDVVNVTGQWVEHPKYGEQFKIATCEVRLPTTFSGVERWLDTRLPWIGPERARQIVKRFGVPQIWDVLENEPGRLTEVAGITAERADEISEAYRLFRVERELMVWLYSLGLTDRITGKVVEKFGITAKELLTENPYRLCDVDGVSFAVADKPALTIFQVPRDDLRRREAALYEVLREECFKDGHVFVVLTRAIEGARKLTSIKSALLEATFGESDKLVIVDDRFVTTKELADAEQAVAIGILARLELDAKRDQIIDTLRQGTPEVICALPKEQAQWRPRQTFTSADGSTRCRDCHLHPDECTCNPDHPMRQIARALAGGDGAAPRTVDQLEKLLTEEDDDV